MSNTAEKKRPSRKVCGALPKACEISPRFRGLAAKEREGQSRKTILELIIGNRHVKPTEIHRIDGGVEAILQGDALRSLLDVTFHGAGTIEILGGGLDRRPLEVRDIAMHGATTKVTLICTGPAPMLA